MNTLPAFMALGFAAIFGSLTAAEILIRLMEAMS